MIKFFNRKFAGIALFIFNRPEHTQRTLEALSKNYLASKSDIIIFCDGPKDQSQLEKINETRRVAESFKPMFKSLHMVKRDVNYGLAKSIIEGITLTTELYDKCIVVEDDILTSKYFLKYMNYCLEKYKNFPKVASIMGYSYPHDQTNLKDTFFVNGADCWGWATWRNKWRIFEPNGKKLLLDLKKSNKLNLLDFDNTYPYAQMLQDQIDGKNDSWAIRWKASAILNDMVTLYPNTALCCNIGHDGSGRHSNVTSIFDVVLAEKMPKYFPKNSKIDIGAYNVFKEFLIKLRISM